MATTGAQDTRLWDMSDPAHPQALGAPLTGHDEGVFNARFSPDGSLDCKP